jgi:hypothetical protein
MPACGVCNIALKNFDKCIKCFLCGIKQHIKCLELEDDSFKFVSTLKNFRFVCDKCLVIEGSSKMDRIVESVSKCTTHSGPKSQKPGHEGCSLVIRAVNSWFLMKSCT